MRRTVQEPPTESVTGVESPRPADRRPARPSITDRLVDRAANTTVFGRRVADVIAELRRRTVPNHWTNLFGVVTLGAFAALRDVAPVLARGLLTGVYDNRSTIARVEEPILILHGTADEVVPIEQAKALQAASTRGTSSTTHRGNM